MTDARTVIMFSTADWDAPYWTNKQHIAKRMADRGFRVLYLESPGIRAPKGNARDISRIWSRLKRGLRPPKRIDSNLYVLSPLTIPFGHRFKPIKHFNSWLMRSLIRVWLSRHGSGERIVWTYHPYVEGAFETLDYASLVYHCVDDIAAVPGVDADNYRQAEQRLVQQADAVFTTSPYLEKHCLALGAQNCVYERNVADIEHFSSARSDGPVPAAIAAIKSPRLCYVGVLSEYKLDFDLIAELAKRREDVSWIFIGEEPERQKSEKVEALSRRPNVHFIGYRNYEQLPDHLRGVDIAVLPNRTDGYMRGVFPMKFYEYMAAGKPVIATPLDAFSEELDAPYISADGVSAWLDAMQTYLSEPPRPLDLDDPRLTEFSWESRLERMLKYLEQHSRSKNMQAK